MNGANHRMLPWLVALLLLATALGVRMLNADILWFDESKTVLYTGAAHYGPYSLPQIWQSLAQDDPWQSPGYFLLLGAWANIAGWSDFAARLLSLLIGLLALAWCYRLGRDLLNPRIGLYATAALAGSSLTIHYFHEMRPYTLYMLMTCIAVWAYWRILSDVHPGRWHYGWLFIGLAGLAYTHVLALLTAIGIGVYHLLFAPKVRRWWNVSGVMLLSALAFVPWLRVVLQVVGLAAEDTRRQEVTLFGAEIIDVLLRSFANGVGVLLLILLLGFALLDRRRGVRLLWVWLITAVATAFVLSYIVPAFIHVRYLMSVWPALALLMAVGLVHIAQRGIPAWGVLALWLFVGSITSLNTAFFESLPNSRYNIPREGFMQMVGILEDHTRPQDWVVLHTSPPTEEWDSDDIFAYYLHEVPAQITHMELIRPFPDHFTDAAYQEAVGEVLGDAPIIWTGIVPGQDFSRRRLAFYEQLERTHTFCQQVIEGPDMDLRLYAQPAGEVVASFGEGSVQARALREFPAASAHSVDVLLGIQRDPELPPDTYSIGLQLLDSSGTLAAQRDYGLANEAFSCRWSSLAVDQLPPGNYSLWMIVYAWRTGERMPADDADSADQRTLLAEVRIDE